MAAQGSDGAAQEWRERRRRDLLGRTARLRPAIPRSMAIPAPNAFRCPTVLFAFRRNVLRSDQAS